MTAPDHSRKRQIPLAPRAPSIHGTQRHSPSPRGASPLLGVERSHFIRAQPGRISTARDPEPTIGCFRSILPGVPAIFQRLLQELDRSEEFNLSSLRLCWSSSGAVPENIVQAAEMRFQVPLLVFFGMTEFCGPFLLNSVNAPRKPASVGTPLSGLTVDILDSDGKVLSHGPDNNSRCQIRLVVVPRH
jgi:acyl-CoA synthetase (AMP-forming)/AMP-acid ligase II